METTAKTICYWVWGEDKVVYGPVELPTVIQWTKDGRVTGRSWVFRESDNQWQQAVEIPELKACFSSQASAGAIATKETDPTKRSLGLKPGALRRIKLFANMDERQLESFLHYLEVVRCKQFSHIIRKGEHGDSIYLILEGEVRALTIVEGKESTLTTMEAGDCFGEISVLDQGPRSVDVIANKDSVLLKLSSTTFGQLMNEAPALAMPFLLALSRSLVGRIRGSTKRYEDTIRFIRVSGSVR